MPESRGGWHPEPEDVVAVPVGGTTRRVRQDDLDRIAVLEAALRETREEWQELSASLIAVSPYLSKPYPDAPQWTPWTQFVERHAERMDEILSRAALGSEGES